METHARGGAGSARLIVAVLAALATGCSGIVTLEPPSVEALEVEPRTPPEQSLVFDADGQQLAVLREEYRETVSLNRIPRHLVDAVLMAEDQRFFEHHGVDGRAVIRALLANAATGDISQGGSTVTQQLVKNLYLPDAPRTAETKVQEALLARDLEQHTSKATILEDYLNTVYFGEGAYGVQAAAWTYFRSDVEELDLAQSALLAAIIRAPETLSPIRDPAAPKLRRDDVLWRLAAAGQLSVQDRDAAIAAPVDVHGRPPTPATREPHFVDLVVRTLLADPSFGATEADRAARIYGGGLRIHTTLRTDVQTMARDALARHLPDAGDPEAAIAMVDPRTGAVLAAVGNRSYEELQFDLPTQARRQPGSTFKAFVLAAAVADGWHPEDRLDGRQGTVRTDAGTWEVRNYDRRSYPNVTLSGATRASVNAAFARLGGEIGVPRIASLARAMGVRSPVPDDPQITIGGGSLAVTPLDLAAAFGTLANLGRHVPTTVVSRIDDASGQTVWQPDTTPQAALSPSAAYVTTQVLRDVVDHGTGRDARVTGWEVAGKTGTTSDHADAWFVGYTPVLSTAVWMGRAEGRVPLLDIQGVPRVTGGSIPARVFADVVAAALADAAPEPFSLPEEEWVLVDIDPRTGLLAASWCPGGSVRLPRILVPDETCPEPPPPPPTVAPPPPKPPEPEEPDEPADETDPPPEEPDEPPDETDPPPEEPDEPPDGTDPDADPDESGG